MTTLADVLVPEETTSNSPGNLESTRAALREAVTSQSQESAAPQHKADSPLSGDKVPAKFRGKSIEEVLDAYTNLESRLGSMANDLGQQRALTDRILQLDLKRNDDLRKNTPVAEKPAPVTANDLLDRPQETLERVVSAHSKESEDRTSQRIANLEAALTKVAFTNKHSDFETVCSSSDFVDWVKASPIRLRAAAAANQGNWQIADELLTEFKGNKHSTAVDDDKTEVTDEKANLAAARRASFDTSGNSGGSGNTDSGKAKGKTYRRVDLIKLRIEDPDSYYDEGFQNEILSAHAEGRIR